MRLQRKHEKEYEKQMKKHTISLMTGISLTAAALALGLSGCGASASGGSDGNSLYVYNWGEYIDESVIDQFEEETGISVVYDVFETNEEMYPVIEAGAVKYDVVCPSDYMIQKMQENGLLAEINFDNIPNYSQIGQEYRDMSEAFDPGNKYSVPYCWGTMGILYGGSGSVYASIGAAFTGLAGYSFLAFNLLCAPCFAAIGAIKREMNSAKWTWFAIGYQCVFAWVVGLIINQLWELFALGNFGVWTVVAFVALAAMVFQIARPMPKTERSDEKVLAQLA